jgi:dipeptidyl aminopeptidase/acylaminoacyl peptidase
MVKRTSIWIAVLCASVATASRATEKRPVRLEDIMELKTVADPAVSPDGGDVVFTVTAWGPENGHEAGNEPGKMISVSHLFRIRTEGSEARQLTFGKEGETAPAWSPDGRWISFLAARPEISARKDDEGRRDEDKPRAQIWLLPAGGGEAFGVTDAGDGIDAYAWSPDSRTIAFTAKDALTDDERGRRKREDDAAVFEGDSRMVHLWTVDVATHRSRQRTRGTAFTVRGAPSWSPDGRELAFAAAPTLWLRDEREDLYLLSLGDSDSDSDDVEKITSNRGPDQSPAFSPDGKSIAYLSTPNGNEPLPDGTETADLRNARLSLYDVSSRTIRDLGSASFDRIPGDPVWSRDGRRLFFVAGDRAFYEVYAYDLTSGSYSRLTERSVVRPGSIRVRAGGPFGGGEAGSLPVVAFVQESSEWPAEVFVAGQNFERARRLTTTNPQVSSFDLGATEVITWKSTDGVDVEGVLLEPVGYQPGRRYPLLVVPHGGPTGAYVDGFLVRYGDGGQHWAGEGWAVLYPNPRGSTNYGEGFMRGNLADWGGGDYRDIMSGVDAVIAKGIADPDRLAIQGWSYGGYMTCWTITQTKRFKAAMIGAGLTDLVSMYGTNDVPNYLGTFFNGTLSAETEQLYRERSGLTHVDQVATPTLILHGGSDERVPIGQPMEFYRALKDRGVATELVFYPREGHGFREYYHRLDRMKRQYDWITRYTLSGDGSADTERGRPRPAGERH